MVSKSTKTALLLCFGIGLLLNPVYLYPNNLDGTKSVVTYEVEPVPNETVASQVVHLSEQTLGCGTERACAFEREVAERGSLRYNYTVRERSPEWDPYSLSYARYNLVNIDGQFYAPAVREDGEQTVLTHRELSTMQALEHIAVPSSETSPEVRRAVETGSVTVVDDQIPEFERNDPIAHDDEVYSVAGRSYSSGPVEKVLVWRMLFVLVGLFAISTAWDRRGRE
ncbi:hypothetical protein AUR64_05320 [Haloprofundus marisrubri]|uniref:Uncharacterized protein n=1 Tax=Haloprofundus marisrubri TaxID=1514971 RepID=A0A0W1RBQ6_9EURY|nr:hypothetical protein [Haloprofundus marisrubri]KTG11130.1 hypothetical protein AUR64_05320 [Haloprofundus marisrubri]